MKDKILVLGSGGMAGHVIYNYLIKHKYNCIGIARRSVPHQGNIVLDVSNFLKVEQFIKNEDPQVVINAVGILINESNLSPSNAILINSYLPHFLSDICRKCNSKLIHLSTDCVFSGKEGGYQEDSFRDADDIYGRSKALGEIVNEKDLTIRTSIIGPELKENGEGLFHWFMTTTGTIKGFKNIYWSGVTTFELARAIEAALKQGTSGLIHLTNNKKISKYDLLTLIKMIWHRSDIDIIMDDKVIKDKSLITATHRLDWLVPDYEEMLVLMKDEIKDNQAYSKYMPK